jgi:hypothetical protein
MHTFVLRLIIMLGTALCENTKRIQLINILISISHLLVSIKLKALEALKKPRETGVISPP